MTRESEIIRRIRQGDIREFETLFRSSYSTLVKYAGTIIRDPDTAEEIVQDFFFRFWQNREKIKVESSLNGYLFRSVHNGCLHHIEHMKVVERHAKEMLYEPVQGPEDPETVIRYGELQARIASILEKLPERCGTIFCMNRFEGLKYAEIARKLSVSVKTVEANMGRALKEFRRALAE